MSKPWSTCLILNWIWKKMRLQLMATKTRRYRLISKREDWRSTQSKRNKCEYRGILNHLRKSTIWKGKFNPADGHWWRNKKLYYAETMMTLKSYHISNKKWNWMKGFWKGQFQTLGCWKRHIGMLIHPDLKKLSWASAIKMMKWPLSP